MNVRRSTMRVATVVSIAMVGAVFAEIPAGADGAGRFVHRSIPDSTSVAGTPAANPGPIATAPDGTLWVGDASHPIVRRLNSDGTFTEFNLTITTFGVTDIDFGADGAMWVTIGDDGWVLQVTPAAAPNMTVIPWDVGFANHPFELDAVSATNAYAVDHTSGVVYHLTGASHVDTRSIGVGHLLSGVALAPDGSTLYVTDDFNNTILRLDPTTMATQFTNSTGNGPGQVTALAGGVVWYPVANGVERTTFGSSVTTTPFAFAGTTPSELVLGTDGGMWFVNIGGSDFGTIAPNGDTNTFNASGSNFHGVGIGTDGRVAGSDASDGELVLSTTDVYADPAHPGVLSGTATVGSTLTVTDPGGFHTSGPVTYAQSWFRCPTVTDDLSTCTLLEEYTSSHVVTTADVGHYVSVEVSAYNTYTYGYRALSSALVPAPPVVAPPAPPAPPVAAPAFTPEQWWAFVVYLQNVEKLKNLEQQKQTCKSVRTKVRRRWVTKTVCTKVVKKAPKKPAKKAKKVVARKRR